MKKKAILLIWICCIGTVLAQPYYFPPTGSSFGQQLNSYGFPPTSGGGITDCYFRVPQMEQYYNSQNYSTQVAYRSSSTSQTGHVYLMVQNPGSNGWAAVDPYLGYVSSPSNYYTPNQVYPTWQAFDNSISRMQVVP